MTKFEKLTRANSPELDAILGDEIKVLDHGFIRVIDYMGNDAAVTQAARVSYGAGTKSVNEDRGLIRYLLRHSHTSPFEMCELKLHLAMPIFVARQWIRHRMASLNEYSARYSEVKDVFYLPETTRVQIQSSDNKQGSGDAVTEAAAESFIEKSRNLQGYAMNIYNHFNKFILGKKGEDLTPELVSEKQDIYSVARELNRINMPVANYTELYWKIDLHNLLHFLSLRTDKHAQYEIRVYADEIYKVVQKWCPLVCEAFDDYNMRRGGTLFSRMEMSIIKLLFRKEEEVLKDEDIIEELARLGVSKREADEFINKIRS